MLAYKKSGFTLVELAVVIVVLAILTSVAVISYNSTQQRSRDNVRSASLYVIAGALEDYYQQHGEYPGCPAMTDDGDDVIANTLTSLTSSQALVAPQADAATTNSISCASLASIPTDVDAFSYTGDSDTDCQSGPACRHWTLQIRAESGDVLSTSSRHTVTP